MPREPERPEHWTDTQLHHNTIQAAETYDASLLITLLGVHQPDLQPKTLRGYTDAIQAYLHWARAAQIPLLTPRPRDEEAYLHHLSRRPAGGRAISVLSPATVRHHVAGVRALYRTLRWTAASSHSFLSSTRLPPDPTPGIVKNPPYTHAEIEDLLLHIPSAEGALLLLCAHTGLRASEALSLQVQQITHHGQWVTVRGKRQRTRTVPLSARTRAALTALSITEGLYFGWSYRQAMLRLQGVAQLRDVVWRGFHAARKYAATRLYHQTHDYTRVAIFLGHTSVDTTRRYVQLYPDDVAREVEGW